MLLAGGEKNSRVWMKVRGPLVKARFIEIHQVFVKKRSNTFLSSIYMYIHIYNYATHWQVAAWRNVVIIITLHEVFNRRIS